MQNSPQHRLAGRVSLTFELLAHDPRVQLIAAVGALQGREAHRALKALAGIGRALDVPPDEEPQPEPQPAPEPAPEPEPQPAPQAEAAPAKRGPGRPRKVPAPAPAEPAQPAPTPEQPAAEPQAEAAPPTRHILPVPPAPTVLPLKQAADHIDLQAMKSLMRSTAEVAGLDAVRAALATVGYQRLLDVPPEKHPALAEALNKAAKAAKEKS